MKIGIDARMYSSSFTGIGRYVYELTRYLFETDKKNEYVLFMNEPEFSRFNPPNDHVKKVLVNAPHYSWAEQVKFARILRREKLDLMHFAHFNAPFFYRRPSVVTIHDLTLSFFPGKKMTSWVHRVAYHVVLSSIVRRSKTVIAVSGNTKKDLFKLLKISPKKIRVIYEGVAKEFAPNESPKEDFLLYTGVWRDHKNLVNLLKAFAILCENPKFTGNLVITGREDPCYPEVKQTINELGLKKRVILSGLVPEKELIKLYQKARIYVLPSFYEGFGLTPLEAMASGTPVVASNTSCIPEICGEKNALFFDPYNIDDMAKTMQKIWFNAGLQQDLRRRGLRRVKDFSWKHMAEETLRLYKRLG